MTATMHIENGKMIFGTRECSQCYGAGKIAKQIPCRTCKGSGRGKRGGARGCKACYGFGHEYDHVNRVVCPTCNGLNSMASEPATRFDTMPDSIWQGLEFRVVRSNRRQTWSEAYLGYGCVVSVTDYGRHKDMTDDQLIEAVRNGSSSHQACKVTREDGTVASFVAILTNDNGYSVVASFAPVEVASAKV